MEKKKVCRFGDIEELISENEGLDLPLDVIEVEQDMQFIVEGWHVWIPSLNVSLRLGARCVPDKENGELMPDFDVTVICEDELKDDMWIYYMQAGMIVTLASWLEGRLSMHEIMEQECYLIL